jgi:hypothetical protein
MAEVRVRARDVLLEAGFERELEAAPELRGAPVDVDAHLGGAHVVQGVGEDLGLAEALGQRDRARAPTQRLGSVVGEHAQLGDVAVGHRQLRPRLERLEQVDGAPRLVLRRRLLTGEPRQARQPAARVALAQAVAGASVLLERAAARVDRVADAIGQIALVRAALQQLGAALGWQVVGEAQRALELGRGLAMGAERGGVLAGVRGVVQHRLGVARRVGVVREPREVARAPRRGGQRGKRRAVQVHAAVGRQRLLDRGARDLVAERHHIALGAQHARGDAGLEPAEVVARQRLEQPQLGALRHDRDRFEHAARAAEARRPGQHGIADGVGNLGAAGREHLGDEERVARGTAVQLGGVDAVKRGERRDRPGRQPRDREAVDRAARGQLADDDSQRMGAIELVVAEGGDHERGQRRDPPREQPQDVERRLVGPVQVLEHDDRARVAPQVLGQRRDELRRCRARVGERREPAARLLGDVEQRPERAWRVERVAGAQQRPRPARAPAEGAHERGLADARLAAYEDEPATAADAGEGRVERGHLGRALEQVLRVRRRRGHAPACNGPPPGPAPQGARAVSRLRGRCRGARRDRRRGG